MQLREGSVLLLEDGREVEAAPRVTALTWMASDEHYGDLDFEEDLDDIDADDDDDEDEDDDDDEDEDDDDVLDDGAGFPIDDDDD